MLADPPNQEGPAGGALGSNGPFLKVTCVGQKKAPGSSRKGKQYGLLRFLDNLIHHLATVSTSVGIFYIESTSTATSVEILLVVVILVVTRPGLLLIVRVRMGRGG